MEVRRGEQQETNSSQDTSKNDITMCLLKTRREAIEQHELGVREGITKGSLPTKTLNEEWKMAESKRS